MKAIFKGSLSFGLVSISVALYSAIKEHAISFKLLCATCKTPITYKRFCEHCNKEIQWNDVVKGLKLKDGSYYIFTQEQLKALKPEKSPTIDINQFIDPAQLSIIYFDDHYYVAPEGKQDKAFILFSQVLKKTGKVAIATFIMHDKEHVCAITPFEDILLLTTLHFSYEIRPTKTLSALLTHPRISSAEVSLADDLIGKLSQEKFNLSDYKDNFADRLLAAIKKGKPLSLGTKKSHRISKEHDLSSLLKESVAKKATKKATKKASPH